MRIFVSHKYLNESYIRKGGVYMNLSLKFKRIKMNLTQEELAKKIGVTKQSISDYERGRSDPSPKTMKKIAKALNSEVCELFFND